MSTMSCTMFATTCQLTTHSLWSHITIYRTIWPIFVCSLIILFVLDLPPSFLAQNQANEPMSVTPSHKVVCFTSLAVLHPVQITCISFIVSNVICLALWMAAGLGKDRRKGGGCGGRIRCGRRGGRGRSVHAVQGYCHSYHCHQGACRCHYPVF